MSGDPLPLRGVAALEESEAEELALELEKRERAARRHAFWAVLGVSPTGLIPLMAAGNDFGIAAVLAGAVLITGIEAWRATRARHDASELRAQLDGLTAPKAPLSD